MSEINGPKILAIIPARGGSKSVPRKNIKPLAGKPLLYYILTAALGSKLLTKTVVSSEDDEILAVAEQYGGKEVPLRRPAELAEDTTADIPVLRHAIAEVEAKAGYQFDYVVMLHATTPLVTTEDIDATLQLLIDDPGADSAVSVYQVNDFHPKKLLKIDGGRLSSYVEGFPEPTTSRRQDVVPVYKRNGGIYVSKRHIMVDQGTVWGKIVLPHIMPEDKSVDINSKVDFLFAETLMELRQRGQSL